MPLRPGQRRTLRDLRAALKRSRRVVYVDFMGSGKTVVLAALIRETIAAGQRVLVLVHRTILLKQARRQLLAADIPASDVGIIWRDAVGFNTAAPVQVATVQTLVRRDAPEHIGLVVVDEGHHAPSSLHQTVLGWLPEARIVLATATPLHNGKPLAGHADEMVVGEPVEDLIADGWLVKPDMWTREDGWVPNMKRARKSGGDFTDAAAEQAMSGPTIIGAIPTHWALHARGLPSLGIAATQAHARRIVESFLFAGIAAETLFAEDDEAAREAKLGRLASGETSILWTCDVLGEGWDFSGCRALVMARPTRSISRYLQWCGRVMRRGDAAVILDHAGNYLRNGGPPWAEREWTLDAVPKTTGLVGRVAPTGAVSFEPAEVRGRLVPAPAVQTVCAGFDDSRCPRAMRPPRQAFSPSVAAKRRGNPWRCASCAALNGSSPEVRRARASLGAQTTNTIRWGTR